MSYFLRLNQTWHLRFTETIKRWCNLTCPLLSDPAATLCHQSFKAPKGSVKKPQCEVNPFLPQPSSLKWVSALTEPALSPIYLQANWFSASFRGLDKQLGVSTITRAPTGSTEHEGDGFSSGNFDSNVQKVCLDWAVFLVPSVILSVTSKTTSARTRLGEPVTLDCGFWADSSSPLYASGFAVEWRYQTRGDGRLVLAYDGKTDRLADTHEEGATLDFEGLYKRGNASLILEEAKVRHSGTYICTVYLPYLMAQVAVDLEVVGERFKHLFPIKPVTSVKKTNITSTTLFFHSSTQNLRLSPSTPPRCPSPFRVRPLTSTAKRPALPPSVWSWAGSLKEPTGSPGFWEQAACRATGRPGTSRTARAPGWSWTRPNWTWAVGGRSPAWLSTLEELDGPAWPSASSVITFPFQPACCSVFTVARGHLSWSWCFLRLKTFKMLNFIFHN